MNGGAPTFASARQAIAPFHLRSRNFACWGAGSGEAKWVTSSQMTAHTNPGLATSVHVARGQRVNAFDMVVNFAGSTRAPQWRPFSLLNDPTAIRAHCVTLRATRLADEPAGLAFRE